MPLEHLSIDSNLARVAEVDARLLTRLAELGLDEELASRVELAAHEAVVNAIVHGNRGRRELPVDLTLSISAGTLELTVRDHSPLRQEDRARVVATLQRATCAEPFAKAWQLLPHGRGIDLMRTLMDTVEYSAHPDGGVSVRMTKTIPGSGSLQR